MSRLRLPLLALVLLASSCGPGDVQVSRVPGEGFVTQVVDIRGDSGAGISIAADADGSPSLAYLSFERELEPGQPPPVPDPTLPLFPAVREAHQTDGVWSRSTVAEELGDLEPSDETAVAVDGDGARHVAWTQGGAVWYASDGGGGFSEPERVAQGDLRGPAITTAEDGTPSISFYEIPGGAEGPAALVRVATPGSGGWEVETAAEADPNEPMSTGIGIAGGSAIVAYGDGPTTYVARDLGERWESEEVGPGGLAVAMDLDGDGTPHLSYYGADGAVREAHSSGGAWEVTDAGQAPGGPGSDSRTSISLDPEGVHWVAWQTPEGLALASDEQGSFQEAELPPTQGAARPQVAAGPEGAVYLAWHDTEEGAAKVTSRTPDEPLLAAPPEGTEPQPGPTGDGGGDGDGGGQAGPPPCEPSGTELAIVAPVGAAASGFDTDCLAAPAGEAFTIDFDNQDAGVPHNVSIYADDTLAQDFFVGDIITGPDQITYEPDPIDEAGVFYFHCDVHPNMNGAFVVQ